MTFIKIAGVEIKINYLLCFSFILFFIFGYIENAILSFVIVFLHELAHTIMAKILGYHIHDIEIFPFGGVARIEELFSTSPRDEIIIAAVGPVSNLCMAFIGYHIYYWLSNQSELMVFFVYSNIVIGVFNLIPILPLDGGRMIRAYLACFVGFKKATKIIVRLSKICCIAIFIWGICMIRYNYLNIFLSFIAIFLYIAAQREYKMAAFIFIKEITHKKQSLLSEGVLRSKQLVAMKGTPVNEIMDQFLPNKYHIVMVVDGKCKLIGYLTETEVLEGMIRYGINVPLEKLLIDR
ncbi:stage IV sporulation protein FB [Anaerosolibacter carboniphilus]|uniref:Stage IV sporulation protein FB n=1 Tax=Anaerosolibacter carboniphilus TaxID=1417629 RepID=A0A841KNM5_9FIRM|nr:M50 family metallopeptidase [Anaerosolibacter carboniphilus]MBB6214881.1 stage IV sporulation protein FB [Anaerosolibacter carboniphilus]